MTPEIRINGRSIGPDHPPFIIAEMSANHNGSKDAALEIITAAKASGADAVKLQTYTADTITIDCDNNDFQISDGLWAGKTLHELYDWAHTPWAWHKDLFDHARNKGITVFSSPFDHSAVDFLEDLNTPAYKIASFEIIDLPLIKYVASTGKPLIISTGMANLEDISEAVDAAKAGGCTELAILHCVSGYPAPPKDYNLRTLVDLQEKFELVTGLSDHTLGTATAVASIGLGCSIIEKHFTLDRSGGGPDDSFSLEPNDLKRLCEETLVAWEALGAIDYSRKASESENLKFRRSLYIVKDVKAGEVITSEHVRSIRPGYGLPPKNIDKVVGTTALRDMVRGTRLTEDSFAN